MASPIIINDEFPIGSVVSYKCLNQMSRPIGDPTIVCDEYGKWSDIQFTCDRNSVTKFTQKFLSEIEFEGFSSIKYLQTSN